jgi:hypothetical protein
VLRPEEKAFFVQLAGPGADETAAHAIFEKAAHGWIFVHELGPRWQAYRDANVHSSRYPVRALTTTTIIMPAGFHHFSRLRKFTDAPSCVPLGARSGMRAVRPLRTGDLERNERARSFVPMMRHDTSSPLIAAPDIWS